MTQAATTQMSCHIVFFIPVILNHKIEQRTAKVPTSALRVVGVARLVVRQAQSPESQSRARRRPFE
jgi:hypothetical protein